MVITNLARRADRDDTPTHAATQPSHASESTSPPAADYKPQLLFPISLSILLCLIQFL